MGAETVGDRLRRFRRLRRLSQEALAEAAGVRQNYIAQLERGATAVPRDPDNLRLLAKALGVKLRDLAEPTGWYSDEPATDEDWLSGLRNDSRIDDEGKALIERLIRHEYEAAERRDQQPKQEKPKRRAV